MSIWLKDGVSTFPIKQPMVGQKDFYNTFRDYLKDLKTAPMARIFPLIGKWGVGKSRIAFELISEALGIDKGWVIRNAGGGLEPVRLLKPGLKDGILPVYIRYSQMSHDLLLGDNWVGYGAYMALCWLADDSPVKSIQGSIVESIHDVLRPVGFDPAELAKAVQKDAIDINRLMVNSKDLDNLVRKGLAYLKQFGIKHIMVIVDEVESETELTRDGLRAADSEELRKKLDGAAIKIITSAIKHEDSRSRYPDVSYLLLCSPAIGDQIKELEALDRRGEMLEIHNNAYADISDYLEDLRGKGRVPVYPAGLVEATYTIAGGNFGWFNVLMAYCDQYLAENPGAEAGEILEDRMASITRVKEKLIDGSQFDYISIDEADPRMPTIRRALLRQLPQARGDFDADTARTLLEAQQLDGTPLFREFFTVKLEKGKLGKWLDQNGYKLDQDDLFVHESTGEAFNLDVLLRSLATYSIRARQDRYVVGKDKDTFLEQVRMLYPKEAVEDAAFVLYDFISGLAQESEDFIGPNFSFLEKLNRRYAIRKGLTNYLLSDEADQQLREHLKELKNDHVGEVKRILMGCARVLEMDYPIEDYFTIQGAQALRTKVHNHLFLGAHREGKVDLVWGQGSNLKDVLSDNKLMEVGAHPVIVLSLSAATEEELKIIKEQYKAVGRCIVFFHLTSLQRDLLEVISVDKEYMDIRQAAHQLAPQFQNRLRSIRDEISRRAKEWFLEADRCGFVLRPIVFSKTVEENIPVLAEGFARMLRFEATVQELGAKEGVKFEQSEDYNRFTQVLSSTQVGAKLISEGYQDAGLFVREHDGYRAAVSAVAAYFLQYLGNSWKTMDTVLNHFFFSAVDVIKPKKIVDQWSVFLQTLGLIRAADDGTHLINVTRHDLEAKLVKVENWLDSDFNALLKAFSGIITEDKINYMLTLKKKYESQLKQAKSLFGSIDLEAIKNGDSRMNEVWKEQLEQLARFHGLCDYIYNEEKWHKTQFNERELEKIKLDNDELPVWYRLRHIQLFHEFITEIQNEVSKKIEERIEEIKKSSNYKGYDVPISPVTNALKRYNTEIRYAKDNKKTTELPTMVLDTETLAFKLFEADYRQALNRLWRILEEVGLCKDDDYIWKEDAGMAGIYARSKSHFVKMVDGYLENQGEANRWLQYFQGAPEAVVLPDKIAKLKNTLSGIDIFLNGGLMQEIDDRELELQDKPLQFAQLLEKTLDKYSGEITVLLTFLAEVKGIAREYRNGLYDENLKNAVNCIRRVSGSDLVVLELTKLPDEATYQETGKKVAEQMKELGKEGREFFAEKGPKQATFDFFKDVVEKEADLDWYAYGEERRELESMGLIKTKVVLS